MLYIGCPMWGYKEWVGSFFPPHTPQGDFLRLYSRRLTAVEGNTTFYAVPDIETVTRWRNETPASFRFCFKVPRDISHAPRLDTKKSATLAFLKSMQPLSDRLGPCFLQLPPAFGPKLVEQLAAFLGYWPTGKSSPRLAVEVRHPDFYKEPFAASLNSLLSQHHAGRVIMDTRPIRSGPAQEQQVLQARERKPDLPLHITTTTDFAFVRYIGHPSMEINNPLLDTWAERFAQWLQRGATLFVFCHCPFEVHSPTICRALYERVRVRLSPATLPALPWDSITPDEQVEQGKLF
jgi:uncharacterized protein YecE (DUF72 family)